MPAVTLLAAVLSLAQPEDAVAPVPFDAITLDRAAELDGRPVTIAFTVGTPAYTWERGGKTMTVCGPLDADDQERTVVLKGDRIKDVDRGKKLRVEGVLRVVRHPAAVVGGTEVPAGQP